jgi:hypothetical protein
MDKCAGLQIGNRQSKIENRKSAIPLLVTALETSPRSRYPLDGLL